jgi:hypothetical protein
MAQASAAAEQGATAPSAAQRPPRRTHEAPARHAGAPARARAAPRARWRPLHRATCPLGSAAGRLRTVAAVRAAVRGILRLRPAMAAAPRPPRRTPRRAPLDALGGPWRPVASLPAARLAGLPPPLRAACGWAGPQAPLSEPAPGQTQHAHRRAGEEGRDGAAALLDAPCDGLNGRVGETLAAMVPAAARGARGQALLRPARQRAHGHSPPEPVQLLRLSPHQRRAKGGTRPGKAPLARLTGEVGEAAGVAGLIQPTPETAPAAAVAPTPARALVPHGHAARRHAATPAQHVA